MLLEQHMVDAVSVGFSRIFVVSFYRKVRTTLSSPSWRKSALRSWCRPQTCWWGTSECSAARTSGGPWTPSKDTMQSPARYSAMFTFSHWLGSLLTPAQRYSISGLPNPPRGHRPVAHAGCSGTLNPHTVITHRAASLLMLPNVLLHWDLTSVY